MKTASRFTVFLLLATVALVPANVAAETLVLQGGTVHSPSGEGQSASIRIEDGLIKAVGATVDTSGAKILDVTGLHVYPGLFDSLSQLGLVEISSIAATVDNAEIGKYNPHLKAATAVHPASEVIPVTRSNGITHTVSAPSSSGDGLIPGQASLIHLDGWTVEEMLLDADAAMVISWPEIQTRRFDFATFSVVSMNYNEAKKKAEEAQDELEDWHDAARHYAKAIDATRARAERDLRLEALAQILDGGQKVMILANNKRDIENAVAFAEKQGLDMILGGGRDAWKAAELLAEKGIPVVLGAPQDLPAEDDDPYDRPARNAADLVAAGVKIAFSTGAGGGRGPSGPHSSRTLPYEAATAVAYGLPREEALKAITINPAEIFGVAEKLGSIEVGKVANLFVADGDPLEISTEVTHLVIQGREVSTDNKHRDLWERYRSR